MMPHTFLEPCDDPTFLATVDRLIGSCVRQEAPQEVHLVHIHNWFGPKWLGFSGKGRVGFFYGCVTPDTALSAFRQKQLTFPPFSPNRIVAQYCFRRTGPPVYEEQAATRLVHRRVRGHSSENLNRRVVDFAPSAQFFWYSSSTASSDRGCVMMYAVRHGAADVPWYASLRREGARWVVDHAAGIDVRAVRSLVVKATPAVR
jgi:hypothetical protein